MSLIPGKHVMRFSGSILLWLFVLIFSLVHSAAHAAQAGPPVVNIGVLAIHGPNIALARWGATAEYLGQQIQGTTFRIVPLGLDQIADAVNRETIDFVLTNTGNYVELEYYYGVSRLATLKNRRKGRIYTKFGAVIIALANREDIRTLQDLAGKRFAAVSPNAFGGYQMAWYELKKQGLDPVEDFKKIEFLGLPHDNIVHAVLNGDVDAGTVRSEVIERMARENQIDARRLKILNNKTTNKYPFELSTRLYPEWPIAKLANTDARLAEKVALALLTLDEKSKAAVSADTAGWTIPLDYQVVHEMFEYLNIGPYEKVGLHSIGDVLAKYWLVITMSILVMFSLVTSTGCVIRNNRKLVQSQIDLKDEVEHRVEAEKQLMIYRDSLEKTVQQRTSELEILNTRLHEDIYARQLVEQALRESEATLKRLYEVVSNDSADVQRHIYQLLQIGCEYLNFSEARYVDFMQPQRSVEFFLSAQGLLNIEKVKSLLVSELATINEPVIYPGQGTDNAVLREIYQAYVIMPLTLNNEVQSCVFIASCETERSSYGPVELDIIRLIVQSIVSFLERDSNREEIALHQAELSHVNRLSTMGEMASGIAHELNQPLTAIVNYTRGCMHRLERGEINSEDLSQALTKACNEAERAALIIDKLWELVRKGSQEMVAIELHELIDSVLVVTEFQIRKYDIRVENNFNTKSKSILADRIQIEQVILNLIINAIDACGDSQDKLLRIDGNELSDCLRVCISNSGKPIALDIRDKIFDAFMTTKPNGMGMGLSISRSILEKHNGKLYLENGQDNLTTFCIELPYA